MVVTIPRVLGRHQTFQTILSRFMVRGGVLVTHMVLVKLRFPPVAVVVVNVVAVATMTQPPVVQAYLATDFTTRSALAKCITGAPVEFLAVRRTIILTIAVW